MPGVNLENVSLMVGHLLLQGDANIYQLGDKNICLEFPNKKNPPSTFTNKPVGAAIYKTWQIFELLKCAKSYKIN